VTIFLLYTHSIIYYIDTFWILQLKMVFLYLILLCTQYHARNARDTWAGNCGKKVLSENGINPDPAIQLVNHCAVS